MCYFQGGLRWKFHHVYKIGSLNSEETRWCVGGAALRLCTWPCPSSPRCRAVADV